MFSKPRNELVNDPNKESLFDVPSDVIKYIPQAVNAPPLEILGMMATLANSCTTMHSLFKPTLDRQRAAQLIPYILYPDETATKEIIKMAQTNPGLFFIRLPKIIDYHVSDFDGNHRIYEDWSGYQLLFVGDVELLTCLKPYLDIYLDQNNQVGNVMHNHEFARQHVLEKFPDGFDFPPCSKAFTDLLSDLETAITHDQSLIQTGNSSDKTLVLLEKLREHYKQGVVKSGHPFNMNDMIKVHKIDKINYLSNIWRDKNRSSFFSKFVIGLFQRFMTQGYFLRLLEGLTDYVEPLKRDYKVLDRDENGFFFIPFDSRLASQLGSDFLIDSLYTAKISDMNNIKMGDAYKTISRDHITIIKNYTEPKPSNIHQRT